MTKDTLLRYCLTLNSQLTECTAEMNTQGGSTAYCCNTTLCNGYGKVLPNECLIAITLSVCTCFWYYQCQFGMLFLKCITYDVQDLYHNNIISQSVVTKYETDYLDTRLLATEKVNDIFVGSGS